MRRIQYSLKRKSFHNYPCLQISKIGLSKPRLEATESRSLQSENLVQRDFAEHWTSTDCQNGDILRPRIWSIFRLPPRKPAPARNRRTCPERCDIVCHYE